MRLSPSLLQFIFCLFVAAQSSLVASCAQSGALPHEKSNPSDELEIIGTIPETVAIELSASWQTTVVNDDCAPKIGWPVNLRVPRHMSFPVRPTIRNGTQMIWVTWWDLLDPGKCGWKLRGIDFKADRSQASYAKNSASIADSRIAFVCFSATNIIDGDCPTNSPRMNDDPSDPITQYCNFAVIGKYGGSVNPCIYGSDGKFAGASAKAFKGQHHLLPEQRRIQLILTDVNE
jgi:hypothetical protein